METGYGLPDDDEPAYPLGVKSLDIDPDCMCPSDSKEGGCVCGGTEDVDVDPDGTLDWNAEPCWLG